MSDKNKYLKLTIIKDWVYGIFGILLLPVSCVGLIYSDYKNLKFEPWYFLVVISVFIMCFDRIEKFNFFGIFSTTLRQVKNEINEEGNKIKTQMAFQSMVSDCHGNDRENVRKFFSSGKIGDELSIQQFSDLYLNILEKEKILSYRKDIGKTVNAIAEAREKYIVTLQKNMDI